MARPTHNDIPDLRGWYRSLLTRSDDGMTLAGEAIEHDGAGRHVEVVLEHDTSRPLQSEWDKLARELVMKLPESKFYETDPTNPDAPVVLASFQDVKGREVRPGDTVRYENRLSALPPLPSPLVLSEVVGFPAPGARGVFAMVEAILNDGEYQVSAENVLSTTDPITGDEFISGECELCDTEDPELLRHRVESGDGSWDILRLCPKCRGEEE